MQTDPVGVQDEISLYVYTRNDPIGRVDPIGDDSFASRTHIAIKPSKGASPDVTIANTVGARGFTNSWIRPFHSYEVRTHTRFTASDLGAVGAALKANPTPGADQPASRSGTRNDVGRLSFLDSGKNYVHSFIVPSPDPMRYTDIVVNYTVAGEHTAHEGFVMRYGELQANGTIDIVSYGEGNALKQAQIGEFVWGPMVEDAWQGNAGEVEKTVCTGTRIERDPGDCPW